MPTLFTLGHGTLSAEAFADLRREEPISRPSSTYGVSPRAGVIRSSRAKPWRRGWMTPTSHTGGKSLWAAGGAVCLTRVTPPFVTARFVATRFTMESDPEFRTALDRLLAEAQTRPTAVLCAESLWWRCHRRLIADATLLLHEIPVEHLLHTGRLAAPPADRPASASSSRRSSMTPARSLCFSGRDTCRACAARRRRNFRRRRLPVCRFRGSGRWLYRSRSRRASRPC